MPQDRRRVALPMLDDAARRWLRDTVAQWDPGHAWVVD
jgi:hypothetical protein